jgi:hypothetical protein
MEWGTIAGILTAIATLITAIGGAVVTAKVMIPNFKTNKATHKIVNQQRTDMLNFQGALIRALKKEGIEVPIDQSLPTPKDDG